MKLIIQIPCYNEAETLRVALDHLPRHIDGVDEIEILIINDGSTDRTVEVAREWGVQHIVSFKQNRGLARGFMAGIDACLHLGADIIVNTDADDQYRGEDIERLVRPILEKKADIVIGERPIDETEHFSKKKKMFQHLGSWVVRVASNTEIPRRAQRVPRIQPRGRAAPQRGQRLFLHAGDHHPGGLEPHSHDQRARAHQSGAASLAPVQEHVALYEALLVGDPAGFCHV